MSQSGDDYPGRGLRRPAITHPAFAPADVARGGRVPPEQPPPESEAPATSFDSEDFLFHLYRGSELLADNCISEAKDELEQALRSQPRDPESQGLLGIVYFRLGMYPAALRIYQELMRSFPREVTPKVNAALCHLRTGQQALARGLLEEVIQKDPEHRRAWGYLGLAFERLGDLEKARAAYERAGQQERLRRLERRLNRPAPSDAPDTQQATELRAAAAEAMRELDDHPAPFVRAEEDQGLRASQPARWSSVELGRAAAIPTPRPPSTQPAPPVDQPKAATPAATEATVSSLPAATPEQPKVALTSPGLDKSPSTPSELGKRFALRLPAEGMRLDTERAAIACVSRSIAVRLRAAQLLLPTSEAFRCKAIRRRLRGRELGEPLGGVATTMCELEGTGHVILVADPGRVLTILQIADELFYLRESCLVAFEPTVHYENGRLARADAEPVPMVQLSGHGLVLVETGSELRSVPVRRESSVTLEADRVLGWRGRLLPRATRPEDAPGGTHGYVGFVGEGTLLLELLD